MTDEEAVRAELVALLKYANWTAVGRQLGVSAQAVKNWAMGKYPSERRLEEVKRLYGLPVTSQGTTKEALPPEWARGLVAEAVDEVRRLLLDPEVEAMRRELAAERRLVPPRGGARPLTGRSRQGKPGGSGR